jgi:hypothetical protein
MGKMLLGIDPSKSKGWPMERELTLDETVALLNDRNVCLQPERKGTGMKKLIAALAVAGTLVAAAPASAGNIDWTSNRDRGRATVRASVESGTVLYFIAETRAADPVALVWRYTCSNGALASYSDSGRQTHSTVGGGWRDAVKQVRIPAMFYGCKAVVTGVTNPGRRVEAFIGVPR